MDVGAQDPERRTECHHLYVSTYNCLVFAAYQGEPATPVDRLQGIPLGLHRLLPLKGIAVNLLFYRVFLKHIGCTPNPFDLTGLFNVAGRVLCGLPRELVTYCRARTFADALKPWRAAIWISECRRTQPTFICRLQVLARTVLWCGGGARFE